MEPKAKLFIMKNWTRKVLSVYWFCLFQWKPFYLARLCKKGQCTKILFWLLIHLSNIFAPYIKNLETYFAMSICFEFWPLCFACISFAHHWMRFHFVEKAHTIIIIFWSSLVKGQFPSTLTLNRGRGLVKK